MSSSIISPADGLDRLDITADGRPAVQSQRLDVTLVARNGVNPAAMYLFQPTPEMVAFDQSLPYGTKHIPSPSRRQDMSTVTTDEERAAWSREAEAEARRRGWMTARRPTWDGTEEADCFSCWRPQGEE